VGFFCFLRIVKNKGFYALSNCNVKLLFLNMTADDVTCLENFIFADSCACSFFFGAKFFESVWKE
jgi:hypothetical protein